MILRLLFWSMQANSSWAASLFCWFDQLKWTPVLQAVGSMSIQENSSTFKLFQCVLGTCEGRAIFTHNYIEIFQERFVLYTVYYVT